MTLPVPAFPAASCGLLLPLLVLLLLCALPAVVSQSFDLQPLSFSSSNGSTPLPPVAGATITPTVAAAVVPHTLTTGGTLAGSYSYVIAPASSFVLYGSLPTVYVSTNAAAAWFPVSGSNNSALVEPLFQSTYANSSGGPVLGNAGCAHRGAFNRFYVMGPAATGLTANAGAGWSVVASDDALVWLQVLSPASAAAMAARQGSTLYCSCVVGLNDAVYSIGSADVWASFDLGQTFSLRSSLPFPARTHFSSVIYFSPGTQQDTILVSGGLSSAAAGQQLNDVWTSTNYGLSWMQSTQANVPFSPVQDAAMAVSSNGVIAMLGGSTSSGLVNSTLWLSADDGQHWTAVPAPSAPAALTQASLAFDSAGYLELIGGVNAEGNWQSSGFRSTLSFLSIRSWLTSGIVYGSAAVGISSPPTLPINSFAPPAATCALVNNATTLGYFDAQSLEPNCLGCLEPWGTAWADPSVLPARIPLVYSSGMNASTSAYNWQVAGSSSWLLYSSGNTNVFMSTNAGSVWTYISGEYNPRVVDPVFQYSDGAGYGNTGCAHRGSFNRWYEIGPENITGSGTGLNTWTVYASNDGQLWINVLSTASLQLFNTLNNVIYTPFTPCVVGLNDFVYKLTGNGSYVSADLGVSWSLVPTTGPVFSPRNYFSAVIFQTSQFGPVVDVIVIACGALSDAYGDGVPTNDVWLSTDYALSWQQVAVGPFEPRMDAALAVSSNGIIAMYGGDYETYPAGYWYYVEQAVWVSPDVGTTWMQVNTPNAPLISEVALVFDSLGFLYMFGGEFGPYENWAQSGYKFGLSFLTISSWWPQAALNVSSQASYAWPASVTGSFSGCVQQTGYAFDMRQIPFNPGCYDPPSSGCPASWWTVADATVALSAQPYVFGSGLETQPDGSTAYAYHLAPAGSLLLYGAQADVWVSTDGSLSWQPLAGWQGGGVQSLFAAYGPVNGSIGNVTGEYGCAHRGAFNRWYAMGPVSNGLQAAASALSGWSVMASNDGMLWLQVLSNVSSVAMQSRVSAAYGQCVVGLNDVVYSLGGADVWASRDLGLTFQSVSSGYASGSSWAPISRFAAVLYYSPAAAAEVMLIAGGVSSAGVQLNSVYSSLSYGSQWSQQPQAAWAPRQDLAMAASLSGLIAMYGGSYTVSGQSSPVLSESSVWVSIDDANSWFALPVMSAPQRAQASLVFDLQGFLYLFAGQSAGTLPWTNDGFKSTQSFYAIKTWAPIVIPTIASSQQRWSSFTGSNVSQPVLNTYAPPAATCALVNNATTLGYFDAQSLEPDCLGCLEPWGSSWAGAGWANPSLVPSQLPVVFASGLNSSAAVASSAYSWQVASSGSWLLYGDVPSVFLTSTAGASWWLLSGIDNPLTVDPAFTLSDGGGYGNTGCGHRTSFNRWYEIGPINVAGSAATGNWTVYASNDGQLWLNVASAYSVQMFNALNPLFTAFTPCVVGLNDFVYKLTGNGSYVSADLGVSWSLVPTTGPVFSPRNYFSAVIFQTSQFGPVVDVIVIACGALSDAYGDGVPTNDVWLSTDYALSWQQVAVGPFEPRMDAALAVSSNGIIAMYGGDYETYPAGYWYYVEQAVWVSPDVGTTWMQVNTPNAPLISEVALVFDSLGFLYMFGGEFGPYENWAQSGYKFGLSFLTISSWWPQAALNVSSQASYAWPASVTGSFSGCVQQTGYAFDMRQIPFNPGCYDPPSSGCPASWWTVADATVALSAQPYVFGSGLETQPDGSTAYAYHLAPAGSLLLYGAQADVWVSTDGSLSWQPLAGWQGGGVQSLFAAYGPVNGSIGNVTGEYGCAHRGAFNRWYAMGPVSNGLQAAASALSGWSVMASNDGMLWLQVLSNVSSVAMQSRVSAAYGQCVVGLNDVVYSLGGADVWASRDLGLTFQSVSSGYASGSSWAPISRFAAVLYYSPAAAAEVMLIAGGVSSAGVQLNSVYSSLSYGSQWSQQPQAAWAPRQDLAMAASLSGLIAMYGGSYTVSGQSSPVLSESSVWVSIDDANSWFALPVMSAPQRAQASLVFDLQGFLYLFAGQSAGTLPWTNDGFKSTQSFYAIKTWAPIVIPTIASSQQRWSSFTGSNVSQPVLNTYAPPAATCALVNNATTLGYFDAQSLEPDCLGCLEPWGSSWAGAGWANPSLVPSQLPVVFASGLNSSAAVASSAYSWQVASSGSWLLYGDVPSVFLTSTAGASWWLLSGIDNPLTVDPAFTLSDGGGYGNTGCGHRTSFNRWYEIGPINVAGSAATGNWTVYASNDGQLWLNVASAYSVQMFNALNPLFTAFTPCVVGLNDFVYKLTGNGSYVSADLGVSWSLVPTTGPVFSPRNYFSAVIFQTSQFGPVVDVIVIACGALSDAYGDGVPTNDVWLSTDYALSWQQVAVGPFEPRMDAALAVSSNGIIAMYGGDYETYPAGYWYYVEQAVWVSPDVGTTWMQVNTPNAPLISEVALVFDSLGFLYMFGGEFGPYENWAQSGYKFGLSFLTISSWWPQAALNVSSQASYAWPASITGSFATCAAPQLPSSSSSTGSLSPSTSSSAAVAVTSSSSSSSSSPLAVSSAASSPTSTPISAPTSTSSSAQTSTLVSAATSGFVTTAATSASSSPTTSPSASSATSPTAVLSSSASPSSSSSLSSSYATSAAAAFPSSSSSSSPSSVVRSSSSSGLSGGAVAGIVIGSVVGAALLVAGLCLLFFFFGRGKGAGSGQRSDKQQSQQPASAEQSQLQSTAGPGAEVEDSRVDPHTDTGAYPAELEMEPMQH